VPQNSDPRPGKDRRESGSGRPRFLRSKTFRFVIVPSGILAILVAFAPWIASGYVARAIADAIAPAVNGRVDVGGVSLGWFGPQRIDRLVIDGGASVGSVEMRASIEQGLWSLATGHEVDAAVAGRIETELVADGSLGILGLRRPTGGRSEDAHARGGDATGAEPASGDPLGGRRVLVAIDGIDLVATEAGPDALLRRYEVRGLKGSVELGRTAGQDALSVRSELAADLVAPSGPGRLRLEADGGIPWNKGDATDGALDLLGVVGSARLEAEGLPLPSKAADVFVEKLLVEASVAEGLNADLRVDGHARVAGAEAAQVKVDVSTGPMRGASGGFAFDPAAARGSVDVRALPTSVLAPFAPIVGHDGAADVRLDPVEDLGPTADLEIVKRSGEAMRMALESQRLRLEFEGEVAADGSRIGAGVLRASASIRPELLRALGVEARTPLVATLVGKDVGWRAANEDGGPADALVPLAGSFDLALASPFEVHVAAIEADVRAETLTATVAKAADSTTASLDVRTTGRFGAEGTLEATAGGTFGLRGGALQGVDLDADLALDPEVLARLTSGAVASRGGRATARISVEGLALDPSAPEPRATLRGRLRVETGGALAIDAGDVEAAVTGLAVSATLPDGRDSGTIDLGARVDGAETRIIQRFDRLPASFDDLAALGLSGSIDVLGIEPALVARMAPAAGRWTGVLGRGPIAIAARNRTEGGAVVAELRVDAASLDAVATVRLSKDAIALREITANAALTPEGIASLALPEAFVIDPGATVSLRLPALALARGAEGWSPSGDLEASIEAGSVRVRRAPGVVAPIEIPRCAGTIGYGFRDERATLAGSASFGAPTARLAEAPWALAWRNPHEARRFRGASGSVALRELDVAGALGRLDPELLGGAGATMVELLTGRGELALSFREDGPASAVVTLDFPRASASLDLQSADGPSGRMARVAGSIRAEMTPETAGRLAGLEVEAPRGAPTRRFVAPVQASVTIDRIAFPLRAAADGGAGLSPDPASAAVALKGTLSALELEIVGSDGGRDRIATGALSFDVTSERLADEVSVRLATVRPVADPGAPRAGGSLEAQARVRGLLSADPKRPPTPEIDGRLAADGFPAAAVDALAGTGGAVRRYLGEAIDAEVRAEGLSKAKGSLDARLASEFATLEAAALTVADGALRTSPGRPVRATFALSPSVRTELLSSLHPVFADVDTGKPAAFTVERLSWPLDGDRRQFDAAFTLETGEVRLVNSGILTYLLAAVGAERTEGFEALLEPLRGTIEKGRLTYRDFRLRAGRTRDGSWRNSLVFSGDVDLAAKPIRANAIVTAVPLSDAANWSSDARAIFDAIGGASPDLLRSLTVGIEFYGPLFDAAGRPVRPESRIKLPDVGEVLRDNPGAIIDAAGSIFDAIRNRRKK